ncbi:MAG: glycosyltransferase family 39 protein [Candidatus Kerfeldbacteria bacterium]|nr:glycosyltransferase family 39 protein [Candidatus Kerfeldbacteria bacterium]
MKRWSLVIVTLLVLLAFFIPRISGTAAYVNTDGSGFWFERTQRFWRGMLEGDFIKTIPAPHPGVTLTWLAGAVFRVAQGFGWIDRLPTDSDPASKLDALSYAAFPAVLVTTLFGVGLFLLFRLVTGSTLGGAFAILFLLIDPWWISQSRQFHLDALAISFSFFGLLTFPIQRTGRWRLRTVVATVLFVLGILTRFSSGIVPFVLVLYLLFKKTDELFRQKVRRLFAMGLIALILAIAVWPVIVVHPYATYRFLRLGVGWATQEHLDLPFMDDQPAWLQWADDPFMLLTRTALIVLGLVAVSLVLRGRQWSDHERLLGLVALFTFVVMWVLPKSLDRYVLPSVVALDVLAGLAVWQFWQRFTRWRRVVWVGVLAVALFGALEIVRLHPYESYARNTLYHVLYPSLAGRNTAFMLGWGEGYREAGEYLNAITQTPQPVVSSWYSDVLATSYRGPVVSSRFAPDAEYTVLYQNMLVRQLYPTLAREIYNDGTPPIWSASINGYGAIWIYRTPPLIAKAKPPLQKERKSRGLLNDAELQEMLNRQGEVYVELTR